MSDNQAYLDFKKEYEDDLRLEAQIKGMTPNEFFLEDFLDKLVSMGEIVDPQVFDVNKKGKNGRLMTFHALAFDESDKSIVLVYNDYVDGGDETLVASDLEKIRTRMLNFLDEAYNNDLDKYFDEFDDIVRIGKDISRRMHKDYVDLQNDNSIDKIKLFVITNKDLSDRIKALPVENFLGKRVECNIWYLERYFDVIKSGRDREPIIINSSSYGLNPGIPCIKANMSDNLDYDAYLAIVPGSFLHSIYYQHGSRLLEGNVRAFLSTRGKINKGIRETIRKEPTKFFTYNNGIACTASEVEISDDGNYILSMKDLQIINGGQTTASLTSAAIKDGLPLDGIFVQMKLTVVKDVTQYDDIVQNISKYANSQNKVTDADLFSNHPFHRRFEELSKKVIAPAKAGEINDTLWYYERSRGKYEQEQFRFTRKSEKDEFARKYPKSQVIKKEELSKYFVAAYSLRPDIVSKGSQKCMAHFAEYIDKVYESKPEAFNEGFYKMCICFTILFRETDKIVHKADWYNVGGYKLNIVPYTISKLIASLPKDKVLDYDKIWRRQTLYPSLAAEIERIAKATNIYIQKSGGVIVTEYCKKEETWNKFRDFPITFSPAFLSELLDKTFMEEKLGLNDKSGKVEKEINIELEIVNLGGPYWRRLIEEGQKRKLLSPQEIDLLMIAASIDTPRPRIASPKQAKFIWKIREKLDNAGVLV